jgi:hypothetical protein
MNLNTPLMCNDKKYMFEVDTLKSKEVIIFLKENLKFKERFI